MRTIDVRLLVPDDVDEEYLVEQLVTKARGSGAPHGAALLTSDESDDADDADDDSLDPLEVTYVFVCDEAQWWHGENVSLPSTFDQRQSLSTQVSRVQRLAARLYPTD